MTTNDETVRVAAILIDPENQLIHPLKIPSFGSGDKRSLKQIYDLVGTDEVTSAQLANGDSAWFDDNGLLKDWSKQHFFRAPFYPHPVAGRFLIVRYANIAHDAECLTDCKSDFADLYHGIKWLKPEDVAIPAPQLIVNGEGIPLYSDSKTWTLADNPAVWGREDKP